MLENKTGYLIQDGTGVIYVWTPQKAQRQDMRHYFGAPPSGGDIIRRPDGTFESGPKAGPPLAELGQKISEAAVAQEATAAPVEDYAKERQRERAALILEAMLGMDKMEFNTTSGAPTTYALKKVLGFAVSTEDRDMAFAAYKKLKEEKKDD